MKKILSHKRFALFAPFIALAALTLMAFALWIVAAGRIADELSANGFSWQKLTREGFPARISLYMDAPRWHGDDVDWQNQELSMPICALPRRGLIGICERCVWVCTCAVAMMRAMILR